LATPRYVPIPVARPVAVPKAGGEIAMHGSGGNASLAHGHALHTYSFGLPMHVVMLVFTIGLGVALAVLLVILLKPPRAVSSATYLPLSSSAASGEHRSSAYSYRALAATLRELLLKLRRRFECPRCTPLEVAAASRCSGLDLFVEVYHEVVYGGRDVGDRARDAEEVVDRCVGG